MCIRDSRFPRMHLGIYRHGCDRESLLVDRKWYRGTELYSAYDTRQVYLDRQHPAATGIYTVLSPWHTTGRYIQNIPPLHLRFLYGIIGHDWIIKALQEARQLATRKPKHPLAITLSKLPPEQAIKHWRRFDSIGAFDGH